MELGDHKSRSFDEMEKLGERISEFDLIVALSPAAQRAALEYTRWYAIEIEYWPTLDPTGLGRTRDETLDAYRKTRDQILARVRDRFPAF